MTEAAPVFSLDDVSFAYPGGPLLFNHLHFTLNEGEQLGLHGPNGCGKTTLLRLIVGLERPQAGCVRYCGRVTADVAALRELRRGVGLVMQNSDDQLFSATVMEDVAFGPLNLGLTRRQAAARAEEALAGLGLAGLAGRETHRLSVGEKKMVSIASVLSMQPRALLLDEPTAALDDEARERVLAFLREDGRARIVVSHDREVLETAATACMRIAEEGRIERIAL